MSEGSQLIKWLYEQRIPLLIFALIAGIYLLNKSPHPGFHDSLSWLSGSVSGFDLNTNATSHFLYRNILVVLVGILPFLSPVLVLTLVTITFSLLSLVRIYQIVRIWFPGQWPGLLVVIMVAFSFTWWQQSEIIEVYTFNAFFFLSFVLYAFRDLKAGTRKNCIWVGLWLSIGLLTHIQHILSLPFFLWYLFFTNEAPWGRRFIALSLPVLSFGGLLVPAVILELHPVSAIFFDNYFRSNVMGVQLLGLLKNLGLGLGWFLYNFHISSLLIIVGIWQLFKKERSLFINWGILMLPYLAFALKYDVQDAHVFFLHTYLLLGIPGAWGWQYLWVGKQRPAWLATLVLFLLPPLLYFSTLLVVQQLPPGKALAEKKAYKGGWTYFLWPGKHQAKDPLEIARQVRASHNLPKHAAEWNLPGAIDYLKCTEDQ